jgi:DNA/RNA-binding domain of Phe-tRNA-synthetase-like protein
MELDLAEGWVEPELAEEFPQLGLVHAPLEVRPRRSPRAVKERLRELANRYTGGKVIHMRQDAVPWAYRVFSRQVGIDPDIDRTPVERIALERLRHGGLKSENIVDDALTLATAETGVPVFALDADKLVGQPGLRLSRPGETLAGLRPLSTRQLVVADEARPVAVVLGEVAHDAGVTPPTERMLLCALRVKGVPAIAVEEALWIGAETLQEPT